jgi:hypothetical protein
VRCAVARSVAGDAEVFGYKDCMSKISKHRASINEKIGAKLFDFQVER